MNEPNLDLPPSEVICGAPAPVGPPARTDGGTSLPEKTCSKCGKTAPASEFPPNRRECRECGRARYKRQSLAWRAAHPAEYKAGYERRNRAQNKKLRRAWAHKKYECPLWRATILKRSKEWRHAHSEQMKEYDRLRRAADRDKYKRRARDYRERNAEALRERARAYYRLNPEHYFANNAIRRARRLAAPGAEYTTRHLIKARWEMFGGRCWICGCPAEATDHMIALAKGGTHWPANLRPICRHHNSTKHARPYREFLPLRPVQLPLPLP